jgi:hypothetical protein
VTLPAPCTRDVLGPSVSNLRQRYYARLRREGLLDEYERYARLGDLEARAATYLDQMRRTAAEEGAAFSVADNWTVESLVAALRTDGPPLQPLIDGISARIKCLLAESELLPSDCVMAVQYPTGSFNAQCSAVPGGFLILINSGLFMLIYQAAKVLSFSIRFTEYDDQGRVVLSRALGSPTQTLDEIADEFATIILAYLFRGDPTFAPQLPVQGGPRAMMMEMIVAHAEFFAVAHEFGHIAQGDLSTPKNLRVVDQPEDDEGPLRWTSKRQQQELDADQVAGALLLLSLTSENENDPALPLKLLSLTSGPAFFFGLDRLITRVRYEVDELSNDLVVTDHPPADARYQRLIDWLIPRVEGMAGRPAGMLLDIATAIRQWVANHEDDVIAAARRRLREAAPLG